MNTPASSVFWRSLIGIESSMETEKTAWRSTLQGTSGKVSGEWRSESETSRVSWGRKSSSKALCRATIGWLSAVRSLSSPRRSTRRTTTSSEYSSRAWRDMRWRWGGSGRERAENHALCVRSHCSARTLLEQASTCTGSSRRKRRACLAAFDASIGAAISSCWCSARDLSRTPWPRPRPSSRERWRCSISSRPPSSALDAPTAWPVNTVNCAPL
mmetsp:Transcript_7367/g.31289  ORF Transcript_7367/g.31289 Transcript_7367/m.31289 type:complete len:214 (-) Transcript_7367:876-1517(-)